MWPFSRRSISEEDLVDLQGKVVIITGGYSGIGYSTTQFLVRKGAKVYLATRNEEATNESMKKLEQEGIGNGSIHWLKLDLLDPHGVKSSAEEFMKKENRLDILINNAAKAFGPYALTKDGLRDVMVTNYLGHYIFTETLLPLLIQTSKEEKSDIRIINVSSEAHARVKPTSFVGRENFNTDYGTSLFNDIATYGLSKLANVLHTKHLQRRLDSQDAQIICLAIHPGAVMTPNVSRFVERKSPMSRPFWGFVVRMIFGPVRQGAMNSAYAAASPEVKANERKFKGVYLDPVGLIVDSSPESKDERLMNELYETTLEILKDLDM